MYNMKNCLYSIIQKKAGSQIIPTHWLQILASFYKS